MHICRISKKSAFLFCFASALSFTVCIRADINLAPLFSYEEHNPALGQKCRIKYLGPFGRFAREASTSSSFSAFSPFWSKYRNKKDIENDILWPMCVLRDTGFKHQNRIFLFYSSYGKNSNVKNWWLIPFWFSGTDRRGDFYWALPPFYGNLRDFSGYEHVFFAMFPAFWMTKKKGVSGKGFLWPLVNCDSGKDTEKFRIAPFYGYNCAPGKYINRFILWPFYTSAESLDPENPGYGWMSWPLGGYSDSNGAKSWCALWPFFEWTTKKEGFSLDCPWPFFQHSKNFKSKSDYKLRAWPLYGQSSSENFSNWFFLWPFVNGAKSEWEDHKTERFSILPFYWVSRESSEDGKKTELRRHCWPFCSYRKTSDGRSRLSILNLWPMDNMPRVERNWSPLWSVFNYCASKKAYSYELLWGIVSGFETEKAQGRFSISLLYDVKYGFPSDSSSSETETVRDFFLGTIRIISDKKNGTRCRLLWLLDF